MAKLYFRYGAVGSAKSLNLLAVAHNYTNQGKRVVVVKPSFDTRFGEREVASRAGLSRQADVVIGDEGILDFEPFEGAQCILVDEAQFLSATAVDQLRTMTRRMNIPVICYGLRTDFRTRAFPGSLRLLELADSIEELKTTCAFCNRKAVFNLKHLDGKATLAGPSKQLGAEELYFGVCHEHYMEQLGLDDLRAVVDQRECDLES